VLELVSGKKTRNNRFMVEISIEGNTLVVEVMGWSKLWCLKSRLDIPLRCVRQVTADGALPKGFWLRLPGTFIPRVIKAGSYWNGSRWSFWDTRGRRDKVVVIALSGWTYDYVVVEVNNPAATTAGVQGAIDRTRGSGFPSE
jgi:hypothetical protein